VNTVLSASGQSASGTAPQKQWRANRGWIHRSPKDSSVLLLSESVARMSDDELQQMDRRDLIDLAQCSIRALPRHDYAHHLAYMTRDQLLQLACLARRSCRLPLLPDAGVG
jgi:hypothetical protein